MALATQCPHCHTTFRVAHDQLKLRAGLVRCGACKEIFNGIEHLLGPDAPPLTAAATAASGAGPTEPEQAFEPDDNRAPPATASTALAASLDFMTQAQDPLDTPSEPPLTGTEDTAEDTADDPLQRMTLMDFGEIEYPARQAGASLAEETDSRAVAPIPEQGPDSPDPLEQAIEDLRRKPWRGGKKAAGVSASVPHARDKADSEEPGFVTRGLRRQRVGRTMQLLMGLASFILLLGLLAQSAYTWRNQLAARWPQAKPVLDKSCAMVGCTVTLPAQIDAVAIESSELQALPGNKDMFMLTTLLRNDSSTAQTWPHIELTLNDASDQALARRIFAASDYLGAALDPAKGLAPNSEQSIKLFFDLSQLKASGYHVALFYP